uniref:Transcriptional regulator n=1 Tax=Bursaphelenchus xylophilus TaxID=6326 RepID=A0A1I7SKV7_BURXY
MANSSESTRSGEQSAIPAMAPTPNTAAVPVFGVGERST